MAIDAYGVAGKAFGFGLWHHKASMFFDTMGNGGLGVVVESFRIVQ